MPDRVWEPCALVLELARGRFELTQAGQRHLDRRAGALIRIMNTGIKVVALSPGWVQTDMGGTGAEISAAASASGLLQVIDALAPAQSGQFLDWQGRAMPW